MSVEGHRAVMKFAELHLIGCSVGKLLKIICLTQMLSKLMNCLVRINVVHSNAVHYCENPFVQSLNL